MLQFKREGDGTWLHGQRRTVVEDGSRWAVNPMTFRRGYICFADKKVVGERLLPVSQPMPDPSELPDHGFPWVQQWAVNLKCLDGADAGVEVVYKPTTVGGVQAIVGLVEEVRDRLNGKMHGGKVSPIVQLGKYDYSSTQYGRIWAPLLDVIAWMSLDGPAPAAVPGGPDRPAVASAIRGGGRAAAPPARRLNPHACIRRPYSSLISRLAAAGSISGRRNPCLCGERGGDRMRLRGRRRLGAGMARRRRHSRLE